MLSTTTRQCAGPSGIFCRRSGLDLLKHLAATGSRVPVIILTAHGDEEARRQSLEAGAVAFLGKPFRSDALLDAVRTALGM